jgi:hypothetical protein
MSRSILFKKALNRRQNEISETISRQDDFDLEEA